MDKVSFKERKAKKKKTGTPFLVQAVFISASFFLIYNLGKTIKVTIDKLNIVETAESEVGELRLDNIELLLRKDSLESEDFIETAARDRLNYSKEGEIVFVIPGPVLKDAEEELSIILREDVGEDERESWEVWKDFLIEGV